MPLEITHFLDRTCRTESFSVPEILCTTCQFAFLVNCAVYSTRTRGIGQRVLKRHKQVVKTPANDHVVVHGNKNAHHHRSKPDPTQVGMNGLPYADGTLADALANGEFQEEQRNSEQYQADKVRNEECTWRNQMWQGELIKLRQYHTRVT